MTGLFGDSSGETLDYGDVQTLVQKGVETAMIEFTALVKRDIANFVESEMRATVVQFQSEIKDLAAKVDYLASKLAMLKANGQPQTISTSQPSEDLKEALSALQGNLDLMHQKVGLIDKKHEFLSTQQRLDDSRCTGVRTPPPASFSVPPPLSSMPMFANGPSAPSGRHAPLLEQHLKPAEGHSVPPERHLPPPAKHRSQSERHAPRPERHALPLETHLPQPAVWKGRDYGKLEQSPPPLINGSSPPPLMDVRSPDTRSSFLDGFSQDEHWSVHGSPPAPYTQACSQDRRMSLGSQVSRQTSVPQPTRPAARPYMPTLQMPTAGSGREISPGSATQEFVQVFGSMNFQCQESILDPVIRRFTPEFSPDSGHRPLVPLSAETVLDGPPGSARESHGPLSSRVSARRQDEDLASMPPSPRLPTRVGSVTVPLIGSLSERGGQRPVAIF